MNGQNVERVKRLVSDQVQLVNTDACRFLVDSYVLEYFTEDHWSKLPTSWQAFLKDLEPPEIADCLLGDFVPSASARPIRNVQPLSLLALKRCCVSLSVPRTQSSLSDVCQQYLGDGESHCEKKLSHSFKKHVKVKKQHQIEVFAGVIVCQAKYLKCTHAVDIGAGLGHLSRCLSLDHKLETICIEAEDHHTSQANEFHREAAKSMGRTSKSVVCKPQHITYEITPKTSSKDLMKMVKTRMDSTARCSKRSPYSRSAHGPFSLVGLHPCGDLSATMLRMFVEVPEIRGFACVPCCYMQLTQRQLDAAEISHPRGKKKTKDKIFEAGASATTLGYPMSKYVQSQNDHLLGFNACELACHSLEQYYEKLKGNNSDCLKCHCYRAVLELIIKKKNPGLSRYGVRINRKKRPLTTFNDYLQQAAKRLDVQCDPGHDYDAEYKSQLGQWTRVVVFYSLRLLLAPVIESLLLCDRLLFLAEAGIDASVVPLFDPAQSPRNLGILAEKRRRKSI